MFIYGGCKENGCRCYCETAASVDGTCVQKDLNSYRLYRFIRAGDIHNLKMLVDILNDLSLKNPFSMGLTI